MAIVKYILPKLIKKNIKIFISLILIAAMGMGLPTALLNSYNGVLYSFEKYFEEYGFPDVTIMSTALFGEEELNAAGELSGVDDVQGRPSNGLSSHTSPQCRMRTVFFLTVDAIVLSSLTSSHRVR